MNLKIQVVKNSCTPNPVNPIDTLEIEFVVLSSYRLIFNSDQRMEIAAIMITSWKFFGGLANE